MNIVLLTNTFTPHVGGVARSVQAFTDEYRKQGHRVLVIAPAFSNAPEQETDVIRIPAIQNFNASDFSVALPFPSGLTQVMDEFEPDVIHSQHPFLLGMTAVRLARFLDLPLVFTHHTLYEQYTHYVPGDSPILKRFVVELATRYANLSDLVFAPSQSIRDLLMSRGVTTPVEVIPTGVKVEKFSHGDGAACRRRHGIPDDAFVVGHMGRLAPEKNLEFLAQSAAQLLQRRPRDMFLVVGSGPSEKAIRRIFREAGLEDRLVMTGVLQNEDLADALNAMDLFAFASCSETQGMVLTEAMAAGLPVVALDAPGAREVVRDRVNGRLLDEKDVDVFREALAWVAEQDAAGREDLVRGARRTAEEFSMRRSAEKALASYEALTRSFIGNFPDEERGWEQVMARIKAEWDILKSVTQAGDEALSEGLFPRNMARDKDT